MHSSAAGVGHHFANGLNNRALIAHAARHDQADVAGAKDHNPFTNLKPHAVDQLLRRAGAVDARRTGTTYIQCTAAALTAAHRQNDRFCLNFENSAAVLRRDDLVRTYGGDHGFGVDANASFLYMTGIDIGIFRAGQLFSQLVQTETIVDALHQNATQAGFAVQNHNIGTTGVIGCHGSGHTGGAAADDDNIMYFHYTSPILPTSISDFPPLFVTFSIGMPSSRLISSITYGPQNPP